MLLRLKLYDKKDKPLCELTLNNMDYKTFKSHFVGFAYFVDCRVKIYEIAEGTTKEKLVADHAF